LLLLAASVFSLHRLFSPALRASASRQLVALPPLIQPPALPSLPALRRVFFGKRVTVLSHEFSRTGAPIACAQLAQLLSLAGAAVRLLG
jgi:hypothetical protein